MHPLARIGHAVELCDQLRNWTMYHNTGMTEGSESLHQKMKESLQNALVKTREAGEQEKSEILEVALSEWDYPEMVSYLEVHFGLRELTAEEAEAAYNALGIEVPMSEDEINRIVRKAMADYNPGP